ncbi:PREDICTED: mucosa-associated lymphoid tissue lymphoma translocation protein 1-like [Nanorana parkeri]|uniref:mucosa-associated lymphoid tissue lymphoma translocation protein 1-like n=1 Tax=Nanorana parkeri TaxID=125878 RepID=UPI000854A1C4|nr:PREDICTED: mucosa-associated lymphoid tissue lymphoma translocation protein 1-like [Nanorana parkeri]
MLKEIRIIEQPVCACVPPDFPFTLRCRAQGPTVLHYQWFVQSETFCCQIPGATRPDLHIEARQTQLYICRVNDQHHHFLFSGWVKVKVLRNIPEDCLPHDWNGEPIIVTNPLSAQVKSHKSAKLQCSALGIPAPEYEWYHNGLCLPHRQERQIMIKSMKATDCGSYLCCVSNAHGERWSEPAELSIEENVILQPPPPPSVRTGTKPPERYFAAGKVALLIGNNGYISHPNLLAPMVDVCELSALLRKLGFCVISLVDLTQEEMLTAVNQFLQLLDKGVYGLFYYAGHGYERSGRNYMVPIDAPQPYRPENCISVQRILQKMQERRTALNVVLLDTCRKWYNSDCAVSTVTPLKPLGNTVYGYATSENAEAYEVQDEEFSSGIFMTYLKKHILKEKKVTHMLEDVLEDIGRDPLVIGKQVMEIRHSVKECRALTDKICTSASDRLNRTVWDHRSKIPKQMVKFSCGVEVELRFKTVFSNLIHTFAKLTHTAAHLTDMKIILYKPSDMAGDSNACKRDPVDSLVALEDDGEEADCMLRLYSLQKCQNDIIIKVDLHFTNLDGVRIQESLEHVIPKPWIAKLFNRTSQLCLERRHRAVAPESMPTMETQLTTDSLDSQPGAHFKDTGEMPFSAQSKSSSEPEENDESDILPV